MAEKDCPYKALGAALRSEVGFRMRVQLWAEGIPVRFKDHERALLAAVYDAESGAFYSAPGHILPAGDAYCALVEDDHQRDALIEQGMDAWVGRKAAPESVHHEPRPSASSLAPSSPEVQEAVKAPKAADAQEALAQPEVPATPSEAAAPDEPRPSVKPHIDDTSPKEPRTQQAERRSQRLPTCSATWLNRLTPFAALLGNHPRTQHPQPIQRWRCLHAGRSALRRPRPRLGRGPPHPQSKNA